MEGCDYILHFVLSPFPHAALRGFVTDPFLTWEINFPNKFTPAALN